MMAETGQILGGILLACAAWLIPRRVAGARLAGGPALLLDAFPAALGWSVLLVATARPLSAGFGVLSLAAGLALADRVKRESLREPVVFSDMSELPQVFTHPHLYLPFAGTGTVLGGAALLAVLLLAVLLVEPALWPFDPVPALVFAALLWAVGRRLSREPALGWAVAALARLRPSGEPLADTARLGPCAALLVHGLLARAERPARRARVGAPAVLDRARIGAAPLVLVQCESFFDARRLSAEIPASLLAAFEACRRDRATYGRLRVGGWGANTVRAEFAVLTGIADEALGYDRFNPYHAFARAPMPSLAWRLRRAGYRTICLHPFDRTFFRRDLAVPALGFERFLGIETIGGSRRPPYCPDSDLGRQVLRLIDAEGPRCFIFAITMGNHGPWSAAPRPLAPALRRLFLPEAVPQGRELLNYLDGLRRSDEMLDILVCGLRRRGFDGVFGFYGDHLPSLPHAFRHFGFAEGDSDYLVWQSGEGVSHRRDLPAHLLPGLLLDALAARVPAAGAASTP